MPKELAQHKCVSCERGIPPFTKKETQQWMKRIKGWNVIKNHHLVKKFMFKNFKQALAFVNELGKIAEEQGHHPDIQLGWGYVIVTLYTHANNGLSFNDFIMAAKYDKIKR